MSSHPHRSAWLKQASSPAAMDLGSEEQFLAFQWPFDPSLVLCSNHHVALNETLAKEFLARTGGLFQYGATITTPRNGPRDLTFEEDNNGSRACNCYRDDDYWDGHHAPQPFPSASAPPPLTFLPPPTRCSAPSPPLPLAPSQSHVPSTSSIPATRSTFPARECPDPWDWFPVLAIGAGGIPIAPS
ncbi:hypothetical protein C8J56DRAFT_1048927 [Mycena floridula]|nr:hypothetical protein C8J56DRAFT_1048927 [Mycena floridula]